MADTLDSDYVEESLETHLSRRDLLRGAAGIAAGASVAVAAAKGARAQAPRRGGILQIVSTDPASNENLDPALAQAGNDSMYAGTLYERLTRVDAKYRISPELATRWRPSRNARTWTFQLRDGVTFSDGTPLTAADVVHSIRRVLDKKLGSPLHDRLVEVLRPSGITARDDRTVVFNLTQTDALLPLALSSRRAAIVKKGTTRFTRSTAIGTGPFVLESFTPGESWSVKRNARYWRRGLPYLDGIRLSAVDGSPAALRAVKSGNADVGGIVDHASAARVRQNPAGLQIIQVGPDFMYIVMDLRVAPFNKPGVVKAIKAAVDRRKLRTVVVHGFGLLTTDTVSWPGDPFYPPGLGVRPQNIAAARRLLREAGYPNGIDIELFTSTTIGGFIEYAQALAEIVAPAGIRVKVRQTDPGAYWSDIWLSKPMYISYVSSKHPSLALPQNYTTNAGANETHMNNRTLDALVVQARETLDDAKRTALYQRAYRLIADRGGVLIPSTIYAPWAAKGRVKGMKPDLEDGFDFRRTFLAG